MIEYNDKYNEELRRICTENPTSYYHILRGKEKHYLFDYIMLCTKDILNYEHEHISNRICFILHKMQELPVCSNPECENKIHPISQICWNWEWPRHCSNRACNGKDPQSIINTKQTKKDRYGDENYNNYDALIKQNMEKFGVPYFFQTDEFKVKAKETMQRDYGCDHPMHSEKIKKEMSDRYLEKTGYKYPFLNPEVMKNVHLRYFYDNTYFKSSWELAYYIWLQDNNIKFEFQPSEHLHYIDEEGKERTYMPDFLMLKGHQFVEIKGDQFIGEDGVLIDPWDKQKRQAKYDCMVKNNVRILSKEEITPYIEYCSKKFNSLDWKNMFRVEETDEKKETDDQI